MTVLSEINLSKHGDMAKGGQFTAAQKRDIE